MSGRPLVWNWSPFLHGRKRLRLFIPIIELPLITAVINFHLDTILTSKDATWTLNDQTRICSGILWAISATFLKKNWAKLYNISSEIISNIDFKISCYWTLRKIASVVLTFLDTSTIWNFSKNLQIALRLNNTNMHF